MTVHNHQDFYEVFYVLRGQGEHRLSNGRHALAGGDLVLVRPTDWHYLVGLPPTGMEWINVVVPIPTWRGALDLSQILATERWDRDLLPHHVHLGPAAARAMERSFRSVLAHFSVGPSRFDLLRFILDVLEALDERPDGAKVLRPDWLSRACTKMASEDNLRGGVARMVALAGVSPSHLCRMMQEHYSTTPTAFIAALRLRQAEILLATTSLALGEISSRCGYASQSYFSKCFRQTQGLSPRDFRRRARQAVLP